MIVRVRLNENGALTEIDWKPTERAAVALLDYVQRSDITERSRFKYDQKIVPLAKKAAAHRLEVPLPMSLRPYNLANQREGWEPTPPEEFLELYSRLLVRIAGDPSAFSLSTRESGHYIFGKYREENHDGSVWEVCWFED